MRRAIGQLCSVEPVRSSGWPLDNPLDEQRHCNRNCVPYCLLPLPAVRYRLELQRLIVGAQQKLIYSASTRPISAARSVHPPPVYRTPINTTKHSCSRLCSRQSPTTITTASRVPASQRNAQRCTELHLLAGYCIRYLPRANKVRRGAASRILLLGPRSHTRAR